jgi:iron complex outermembrane receptor protein
MFPAPVPRRTCRATALASLLPALLLPPWMAWAEDGETASAVIVTGTYAKKRTIVDSESPVDVLTGRDLQNTGSTELATALNRLLPSFNFPRPAGGDATDAVRPAQLRGLAPDEVLVLVNGKRRHVAAVVNVNGTQGRGSSAVDLNAIPISAIDRIEILRDGAAAQYGSDAIAGVINIILRKGGAGGELDAGIGQYGRGDGRQESLRGHGGFPVGTDNTGWFRIAAEMAQQDPTNRADPDLRNPAEPRYGQVNQRYGDPQSRTKNLFFNGQLAITPEIEIYAFGNVSERWTSAAATWRTAYNGTALRTPIFPQGFLPLEDSTTADAAFVAGMRIATAGGWHWDFSLNHGENRFRLDVDNTVNQDMGAASPTHFYAGQLKNAQTLFNIDAAREFDTGMFAGPLTLAIGAELRKERYDIDAGEPASYFGSGAQGFSGFRPSDAGTGTRRNTSAYVNLEAEFTSRLSATAAVRKERFSDFGGTTSEKLSLRYAFADAFAMRATASTGFRAPSLAQENYTITTTNFFIVNGVNTPIETGTFGVGTAAARALGARPLKPETSRNLSLGAQWQPGRNVVATIDAYEIDIDDRILFSANLVLPNALRTALANLGILVGAARYFTNAFGTRTRGMDMVGTWHLDIRPAEKLDLTLGYNRNRTTVRNTAPSPDVLVQNGLTLIDRQTIGRATVTSPKDKLAISGDYTFGRWNLHAGATRYGAFTVPQNTSSLDQEFGPAWVFDLSAGYRVERWRFMLGIDNATDRYPDPVTSAGNLNNGGITPYSIWSPFGFNGRFYYARTARTW